jgi:hypothetical protein
MLLLGMGVFAIVMILRVFPSCQVVSVLLVTAWFVIPFWRMLVFSAKITYSYNKIPVSLSVPQGFFLTTRPAYQEFLNAPSTPSPQTYLSKHSLKRASARTPSIPLTFETEISPRTSPMDSSFTFPNNSCLKMVKFLLKDRWSQRSLSVLNVGKDSVWLPLTLPVFPAPKTAFSVSMPLPA